MRLTLEDFKKHADEPVYRFVEDIIWDLWSCYVDDVPYRAPLKFDRHGNFVVPHVESAKGFINYYETLDGNLAFRNYLPEDESEARAFIDFCVKHAIEENKKEQNKKG